MTFSGVRKKILHFKSVWGESKPPRERDRLNYHNLGDTSPLQSKKE